MHVVVFDVNVLVSSLIIKGKPRDLWLKARANEFTLLKPLEYFVKKAKLEEEEREKSKPAPKAEPAPVHASGPESKGAVKKIKVKRARGKEGVLPKSLARQILLARMKRLYPDSDYEILVENMMDDYDPMVTFNENMSSLARSERWSAFARAFEYVSDAEAGQFTPSEADEYEKEELYRQLDDMIGRIYEEHPLEFQEYLVSKGIAEAA